MLKLLVF